MARVCLFHWKPEEAQPLLAALRSAGHEVEYKDKMADFRALRQTPPEAIVIDLSRLPSHGRELGIFFRRGRATRHIPLLFVNGDAEKVDRVRALLPDAAYTTALRIKVALRTALANPPANPAKPISPIERWAGRSTAQKLGIAKDARVAVIDPPPDYVRAIGDLPEGASFEEEHHGECKLALWFVYGPAEFQAALPRMRRLAAHARLWILWRKARQDGLNGNVIREGAIAVGLVDYKICSVNETWSAMVFAIKKAGNPVQSK